MTAPQLDKQIKSGLPVESDDGVRIGTVSEVWTDVGVGEAWGSVGSIPQPGAQATDPDQYAYSEAMPGEGDDYFRMTTEKGEDLYVPFNVVRDVQDGTVRLSVDADTIPALQWDIKPDFVNVTSEPDSQGGSRVA